MQIPSLCPICKNPMVNDYAPVINSKNDVLRKSCSKRLDHKLNIICVPGDDNTINSISLKNHKYEVIWSFGHLYVTTPGIVVILPNKKILTLPFFEPNLYDLKSLYNKLKLCIIFS